MGQTTIAIQAHNLVWGAQRTARGTFVGACDSLGLTIEADTEADLKSLIAEGTHVLLVDLLEDGELPRFLSDRGWNTAQPIPIGMPEGGVTFDVPFRVEMNGRHP